MSSVLANSVFGQPNRWTERHGADATGPAGAAGGQTAALLLLSVVAVVAGLVVLVAVVVVLWRAGGARRAAAVLAVVECARVLGLPDSGSLCTGNCVVAVCAARAAM